MANFNILKAAIDAVIKANGQQEITGPILNSVLKAIVDSLGAGFELAGVATPSTNPGTPDQDVYWLAYQGGTYTNFGGAVLPTGISMLKWDGSWTSQTFFTVDDQLTPNSNNLAKSGVTFDAVMRSGAFDLTAYNGGVKYADLSAALTELNSLPAAYKRGGMSIKFVSSVDNKYVQYRLMSNSFNTIPSNWQGVINEVKAGSRDLVESGGIFNAKDVIVISHITKKYVSTKLNANEYGYNTETFVLAYKDSDNNITTMELKLNTLYYYNGILLRAVVEDNVKKLTISTEQLSVSVIKIGISNAPGLYYSPTANQLVLVSEEQSGLYGEIRKDAPDGTIINCKKRQYIIKNNALVSTTVSLPIIIPISKCIRVFNSVLTIPAGTRYIYDNSSYQLSTDLDIDISSISVGYLICNESEIRATVASELSPDDVIITPFCCSTHYFKCNLPDSFISTSSSFDESDLVFAQRKDTYHEEICDFRVGFMSTGSSIGDIATFSVTGNGGWQYVKTYLKKGDVAIASGNSGNVPKSITVTDQFGKIKVVLEGSETYKIMMDEDGFIVVNKQYNSPSAKLTVYRKTKEPYVLDLNCIAKKNLSQILSSGEIGYNSNDNKIYYKDLNGNFYGHSVVEMGDVLYGWYGGLFKPDFTNNSLTIKQDGYVIPVRSVEGVEPQNGFYYSPSVSQVVCISVGIPELSPSLVEIRSTISDEGTLVYLSSQDITFRIYKNNIQPVNVPELVKFSLSDNLVDYTGEAQVMPYNGQVLFAKIYEKMDELAALYPNYITKVDLFEYLSTEMASLGVNDYPDYANGIETQGTYLVTPEYRTYMYILSNSNRLYGNKQINSRKNVLLVGGTHGNEYVSQTNCYHFAKLLCEGCINDRNYFALRNACDFYIIPMINGYGTYHGRRLNANGVNLNRNFDTQNGFVVSGNPGDRDYTGSSAFSEFETKLVKCITEKISPNLCIDHHSYFGGGSGYQVYFGCIPTSLAARVCYQIAVDFCHCVEKHYPEYFGNSGNILITSSESLEVRHDLLQQAMDHWWADMKNIKTAVTCEVSHVPSYNHGEPATDGTFPNVATDYMYSINEYYLRATTIRLLEAVFELDKITEYHQ